MKQQRPYPAFTVTAKAARSLANGHPWVYEDEVTAAPACENGCAASRRAARPPTTPSSGASRRRSI